ncbi:phage tail protein I [Aquibium sp. ELW1220]|uniref:phage tail protein I n=1 Tax=Aquibium sp. ELW1220 TaxID=2976766 RepID=UPI0025B2356D|nr:phage tail protein I [Aquibium sp. ELW1220]MDN2582970.1 phage tail protein I [Aquibium sp. ELW1220]
MTRDTLLPQNRTAFEEAADLTGARSADLPLDVPKLVRPFEVPAPFLPWVAWGLSVDFWEKEWPEDKHRLMLARSLRMHARKGTATAIAEAVRIMGGDLRRFIVPPAKTHLSPAFTPAEREAYLALFAQLRVYPFVARGRTGPFGCFLSVKRMLGWTLLGPIRPVSTNASRYTRTAKLWDRGVETTLTVREGKLETVGLLGATAYDEVILGPKATRAIHLDAPPRARGFLVDDQGVAQRMIRIPRDASYEFRLGRETYTTVWPQAQLIDVRPQFVTEIHSGQKGAVHAGGGSRIAGGFLPPTIAWRHLFERWHIHDPDRIPIERCRSMHLGNTRLGMPAYHAEASIRLPGRRPWRIAGRFVQGFVLSTSKKPIADARHAVRITKSLRDKILIDTKTHRAIRAGDRLKIGQAAVGGYIEV